MSCYKAQHQEITKAHGQSWSSFWKSIYCILCVLLLKIYCLPDCALFFFFCRLFAMVEGLSACYCTHCVCRWPKDHLLDMGNHPAWQKLHSSLSQKRFQDLKCWYNLIWPVQLSQKHFLPLAIIWQDFASPFSDLDEGERTTNLGTPWRISSWHHRHPLFTYNMGTLLWKYCSFKLLKHIGFWYKDLLGKAIII